MTSMRCQNKSFKTSPQGNRLHPRETVILQPLADENNCVGTWGSSMSLEWKKSKNKIYVLKRTGRTVSFCQHHPFSKAVNFDIKRDVFGLWFLPQQKMSMWWASTFPIHTDPAQEAQFFPSPSRTLTRSSWLNSLES